MEDLESVCSAFLQVVEAAAFEALTAEASARRRPWCTLHHRRRQAVVAEQPTVYSSPVAAAGVDLGQSTTAVVGVAEERNRRRLRNPHRHCRECRVAVTAVERTLADVGFSTVEAAVARLVAEAVASFRDPLYRAPGDRLTPVSAKISSAWVCRRTPRTSRPNCLVIREQAAAEAGVERAMRWTRVRRVAEAADGRRNWNSDTYFDVRAMHAEAFRPMCQSRPNSGRRLVAVTVASPGRYCDPLQAEEAERCGSSKKHFVNLRYLLLERLD